MTVLLGVASMLVMSTKRCCTNAFERMAMLYGVQGYLPGQLYKLQSLYGGEEELKQLLAALKEAGLVPVADIVINHRCADAQDENGVWNNFRWGASTVVICYTMLVVAAHVREDILSRDKVCMRRQ